LRFTRTAARASWRHPVASPSRGRSAKAAAPAASPRERSRRYRRDAPYLRIGSSAPADTAPSDFGSPQLGSCRSSHGGLSRRASGALQTPRQAAPVQVLRNSRREECALMDGQISISPQELYAAIGTASAPVLIDVRRDDAFAADERMLVSA